MIKLIVRWDVLLAEMDKKSLAELVMMPTIRQKLYRLISCGRRYIRECGNKLRGGSMIVKRALMCASAR